MRSITFTFGTVAVLMVTVSLAVGQNTVPREDPVKKTEIPKESARIKPGSMVEVMGTLEATDPADPKSNEPHKLHKVKLAGGKTYVVQMTSGMFDTFLRLESANGKELAEDDDGAGDTDSQIVYHATRDEEVRIIATRFEDGGVGNYRLTVRELAYQAKKILDVPEDGLKISDKLAATDPADVAMPGKHFKRYTVKLKAGQSYQIQLKSGDFDAYLRLHDEKSRLVDADDDSGGNLDAQILHQPQNDGVFHIIVTGLDVPVGDFELIVRKE